MSDDYGDDRPILDATPVVIRHVRRPLAGETRTISVLNATFTAVDGDELDALNDADGWTDGEVSCTLAGDGSFRLRLPNVEGSDGILHRDRFAIRTDPNYRAGLEWVEVYREPMSPDTLLFVGTPTKYRATTGEIELSGNDATVLFTLARASAIDVWRHAPRDVFDRYMHLPRTALLRDFAGWTIGNANVNGASGTTPDGWVYVNAAAPWQPGTQQTGVLLSAFHVLGGTGFDAYVERAIYPTDTLGPEFTVDTVCEVRGVASNQGRIRLEITIPQTTLAGVETLTFDVMLAASLNGRCSVSGTATVIGAGGGGPTASPHTMQGRTRRQALNRYSLRVIVRNRWAYCFLEGELVCRARIRNSATGTLATKVRVQATDANVVVQRLIAHDLRPFGARLRAGIDSVLDYNGDARLPGAPPPGGLRGRYYTEAPAYDATLSAGLSVANHLAGLALDPLDEPVDSRLDTRLAFATADPPIWQPPAAQNGRKAFSAVWTGAVYLDLTTDLRLRFSGFRGYVRLYIGRTLPQTERLDFGITGAAGVTDITPDLRATLGAVAGWYPIRVEFTSDPTAGGAGLTLEDHPASGVGGTWTTVPTERLSPLGCFEDEVRHESHRELLDRLTETFGYQWRAEYMTFESGHFPTRIRPLIRAGVDTDKIIATDNATDLAVELDAGDAVDALLIDAAGIADPLGAEQLSIDALNFATIPAGLFLTTGFESLAETTEENGLTQRAESLLALRSGPNEVVAARPQSIRDELVDTFPLTGALGRLKWQPGDGVRLAHPDLGVVDVTPRQLLSVGWAIWPDGTAPPVLGYRQRPRGIRAFMRRTLRAALTPQRAYQGQSAVILGALGAVGTTAAQDAFSRLPVYDHELISLTLDVAELTPVGAVATLVINGVNTGLVVGAKGSYPVDRWATAGVRQVATVTGLTGGAVIEFSLRARVRI